MKSRGGQPTPMSLLRHAAKARGNLHFNPGVPCRRGHLSARFVSTGTCVKCIDTLRQARHTVDPSKRRLYAAEYRESHKADIRRQGLDWRRRNRERHNATAREWRRKHPKKAAAITKRWRRGHPDKVRALDAGRRGRKLGVMTGERRSYAAFVRWARTTKRIACYWCHRPTSPAQRHLDHIVPLTKGGPDTLGNLCVSCKPCNRRKWNKLPEQFTGQSELRF